MSTPEKCKKCGFRLPPGRIARCPMCKTALTQTQLFRRPILPDEPPPAALAETKPVDPPPEVIEKVKRALAKELFGDSDAQLDALVEGEPEAPPEPEERPRAEDI